MIRSRSLLSTYRIQLRPGFGFPAARDLLPYLHRLGISHLYLSPVFQAHPGSYHGYDVTDPTKINAELGTREEFDHLAAAAAGLGMGLVLDVVPNHMAVSHENPYWSDVLEYGAASRYADVFDISWDRIDPHRSRILIPCLGQPYGRVLESGELRVERERSGFFVRYYDRRFPLNPRTWVPIFSRGRFGVEAGLDPDHPGVRLLRQICSLLEEIPAPSSARQKGIRPAETAKQAALLLIERLQGEHPDAWAVVEENIRWCNGEPGDPRSYDPLDQLLEAQAWRLSYWRVATESVGYRRFFDISDLIGVRVELPEVFELTHSLVLELAAAGLVDGLRLDHVDGLLDPEGYLRRLRMELSRRRDPTQPPAALFVEKILGEDEVLPGGWPVEGTTGYERMRWLTGLWVEPGGFGALEASFRGQSGRTGPFDRVVSEAKRQVLQELLAGEMEGLALRLRRIATYDRHARHLLRRVLEPALEELTLILPVYRTYVRGLVLDPPDRVRLETALDEIARTPVGASADLRGFLQRVFLGEMPYYSSVEARSETLELVMRWQQLTGPVMAKGLEDTAHYRYHPLLAVNEVGNEPTVPSDPVASFHERMTEAGRSRPLGMIATSTHDTKRSEDVRARLCVLSELAGEWDDFFARSRTVLAARRVSSRGQEIPDPGEEWLLLQTLLGAWPLDEQDAPAFAERVEAYMIKAAREAKLHTAWHHPDEVFESTLKAYVHGAVADENTAFREVFTPLQKKVAWYGALNGLSQTAVKLASIGLPDFYQGTELWDFSLVDPDNRRPVDFARRERLLEEIEKEARDDRSGLCGHLLQDWQNGRVKLYLTWAGLHLRQRLPALFRDGEYLALRPSGARCDHLVTFARCLDGQWVLLVAPRLYTTLAVEGVAPLGDTVWPEERIPLPGGAPRIWRNELDGRELEVQTGASTGQSPSHLEVKEILRHFPVALLTAPSEH